ncbi:MAG: TonB family protein [Reinekea sp.]
MSSDTVQVNAFDRLSFTIFLALAVHALLIFGISFSMDVHSSKSPTLDVTLSLHKTDDKTKPEDADFLADSDQQGSGTLEEKAQLNSTEAAEIEDNQIFHTTPTITQIAYTELSLEHDRIITSKNADTPLLAEADEKGSGEKSITPLDEINIAETSDVKTLKAILNDKRQSYAKRPRIKTLTAMSTERAVDAKYIYDWLKEVERIGNQNYPDAARKQRLTGSVRLAVSINSDGTLRSVEVSQSSGHSILDQAAKQIVHVASPYTKFNAEMLEEYDVLTIIRTWQFRIDNSFGLTDG